MKWNEGSFWKIFWLKTRFVSIKIALYPLKTILRLNWLNMCIIYNVWKPFIITFDYWFQSGGPGGSFLGLILVKMRFVIKKSIYIWSYWYWGTINRIFASSMMSSNPLSLFLKLGLKMQGAGGHFRSWLGKKGTLF